MTFFHRKEGAEDELAALADGSLPPERRAALEQRVADSPELAALLDEQRVAVNAVRAIDVGAPAGLRARIEAQRAARSRPRRRRLVLAGGFAAAAAVVVLAVLVALPEGAGGPSVAEAATVATLPATGPAPEPLPAEPALLAASVEGVAFPSWDAEFGWAATGTRDDDLDGRGMTTVFYEKEGKPIGYTIVEGDALDVPPDARVTHRQGIELRVFREDGRNVVTWMREGHSCVLSGNVPQPTLVKLAAWKGMGAVTF